MDYESAQQLRESAGEWDSFRIHRLQRNKHMADADADKWKVVAFAPNGSRTILKTALKYEQARRLARKKYKELGKVAPRILREPPKRKTRKIKETSKADEESTTPPELIPAPPATETPPAPAGVLAPLNTA